MSKCKPNKTFCVWSPGFTPNNSKRNPILPKIQGPRNLYIIGASVEETGNLVAYYPTVVSTEFNAITDTDLRVSVNPSLGFSTILGPLNRHSQAQDYVDFLSEDYLMPLVNSSRGDVVSRVRQNGNIVNYAVSGATTIGNHWNNTSNLSFVPGLHGYDSQVAQFVSDVTTSGKVLTNDDAVFYSSVNANDATSIAVSASIGGPGTIPVNIALAVGTHIANIQALYDVGVRQIYFDYVDAAAMPFIPSAIKADIITPGTLAALQGIVTGISTALIPALSASVTMPGLHLSFQKIDNLIVDIFSPNYYRYGLPDSYGATGDPRYHDSTTSIPTYLDTVNNSTPPNIQQAKDSVFIDDNHLTLLAQRVYATEREKRILTLGSSN